LAGIFGVGLADGHVGILRRIWRFMNRKRLRLRRNAEVVWERLLIWVHGIGMRENGKRKLAFSRDPIIFRPRIRLISVSRRTLK
jgi:hypothetical protein